MTQDELEAWILETIAKRGSAIVNMVVLDQVYPPKGKFPVAELCLALFGHAPPKDYWSAQEQVQAMCERRGLVMYEDHAKQRVRFERPRDVVQLGERVLRTPNSRCRPL